MKVPRPIAIAPWTLAALFVATLACSDDSGTGSRPDASDDTGADNGTDGGGDVPGDVGDDPSADAGGDDLDAGGDGDAALDLAGDAADVSDETADADTGIDVDMRPPPVTFELVIGNVSDGTEFATVISPGAWVVHTDPNPIFEPGTPDRGVGLEALAEDGEAASLISALAERADALASGATAVAAPGGGPSTQTFEAFAEGAGQLSVAAMFVASNDLFISNAVGIDLFDEFGEPIPTRDVTDQFELWDAGTEANQRPGLGPDQPPALGGPAEGIVRPYSDTTRALPYAFQVLTIEVSAGVADGAVDITFLHNGAGLSSELSSIFYAMHDADYALFSLDAPASNELAFLARDGLAGQLEDAADADESVDPNAFGDAGDSPAPGGELSITLTPDPAFPRFSFASMLVETNDTFVALPPAGVSFFDEDGLRRGLADIEADINRQLAFWDAGREVNEVPGIGVNQPQRNPVSGTAESVNVHRYDDDTTDLADPGGIFTVIISQNDDGDTDNIIEFDLDVTVDMDPNEWDVLGHVVAMQSTDAALGWSGLAAPAQLEAFAEDGDSDALVSLLDPPPSDDCEGDFCDVSALGGLSASQLFAARASHPRFNLFISVLGTNDSFLWLGPGGVSLADVDGDTVTARSDEDINDDIAAALTVYDAGTEANQAAALGTDQAPEQDADGDGAAEGDGTVRPAITDPVWAYPDLADVVRITLGPTSTE